MAFDLFPADDELLAFFMVEPETFAELVTTYKREHNGETLYCSFTPLHGDIDITLLRGERTKAVLSLSHIQSVKIERGNGGEHLIVAFSPDRALRDFVLSLVPEVSFVWGTTLDME